jgi:spore coat polysaccharide biosynthesis protein SpsF
MKLIKDKTVLEHVINRVEQSKLIDEIIIATTTQKNDDIIEKESLRCGAKVFRGREEDVLGRYYYAAKEYAADVIVRITSDCPLIDPYVIDDVVDIFLKGNYEIVANAGINISTRTFPRGLDVEVFSFEVLEMAFKNATENYQREHVTPYIHEKSKNKFCFANDLNYSKYRWTLDTAEDFQLISEIYNRLYFGKHDFYMKEILELFEREPDLYKINAHIQQKRLV